MTRDSDTGRSVWRGRRAIAASILGVVLIAGYLAASRGELATLPPAYLLNAVVLALAYWFPAVRIESVGDLAASWTSLVPWLLAWTLVWDLATAGVLGERELFQEWWVVYPSGVLVVGALLALTAAVVQRVGAAPPDGD